MKRNLDEVVREAPEHAVRRRLNEFTSTAGYYEEESNDLPSGLAEAIDFLERCELLRGLCTDMSLPGSLWNHVFAWASSEASNEFHQSSNPDWQLDSFYLSEILGLQSDRERELRPDHNYLRFHPALSPLLRASLVQLMITATRKFKLNSEVLHQAVGIVDRYLSRCQNIQVAELEEIGIAAMLLSYKNEAANAPFFPLANVCQMMSMDADGLRRRVVHREVMIGETLEWNIFAPSACAYLHRVCFMFGVHQTLIPRVSLCLAERALLEIDILKFLPSTVAVTAFVMASAAVSKAIHEDPVKSPCWSHDIYACTQIHQETILPCLHTMISFLQLETLSRGVRFAQNKLQDVRPSMANGTDEDTTAAADDYDILQEWTLQEIETQSYRLARFVPRSEKDEKWKHCWERRLEYLAYLPVILEFSAKMKLLSDAAAAAKQRKRSPSTGEASAPPLTSANSNETDDSMVSGATDRDDSGMDCFSSFLSDEPMSSTTANSCNRPQALASLGESVVAAEINKLLTNSSTLSAEAALNPNLADSVFYRYSDVYHYLVTYPPTNE